MSKTKIEWADEAWNPVWGCLNPCWYCYARNRIAPRFGKTQEQKDFIPTWIESNFNHKFAKSTKRVFVNSMSDVMYWKKEWWDKVLLKINQYPDIDFIFLTKGNPDEVYLERWWYPSNCILGITATNPDLSPTKRHYPERQLLNIEPILSPQTTLIPVHKNSWVIIGALTGSDANKYRPTWAWYKQIVIDCVNNGVPIFIKPSLKDITPPEYYLQQFPERVK